MPMYQGALRHANGQIEGFIGIGATESEAKANMLRRMASTCEAKRIPFPQEGIITHESRVTVDELNRLRADWRIEAYNMQCRGIDVKARKGFGCY